MELTKKQIKLIKEKLSPELTEDSIEESYREVLDSEGPVEICGMRYLTSRVLSEVDPTAYRCGLADFEDSEVTNHNQDLTLIEGDYYLTSEVEDLLNESEG